MPSVEALLRPRKEERVEFGLARLRAALRRLKDPQERFASVLVAGTNGKGSVSALLAGAAAAAGRRAGLYTSPHLRSPTERVRLDGREVPDRDFAACVRRVLAAETEPLSYFELVTAAAFVYFAEAGADLAVLEIGMGGRLDASNVVRRPLGSVIASVSLDHVAELGGTVAAIAREKAGVLRPGTWTVCGPLPETARAAVEREAERRGARLLFPPRPLFRPLSTEWEEGAQTAEGPGGPWRLGLLGEHQLWNATLAYLAARRLGGLRLPEPALRRAFAEVRWPGRFQVLRRRDRLWVLDGAHNGGGAEAFAAAWSRSPWRGSGALVTGLLRDKDPDAVLGPLAPLFDRIVVCAPRTPRALPAARAAAALRRLAPSARIELARTFAEARRRLPPGRPAAVTGSLYLVGEALEELE